MSARLSEITEFEVDHFDTECFAVTATKTGLTVPSDCDCLVIAVSGYCGGIATEMFADLDPPAWDNAGTPQAMSIAVRHADASGNVVELWYLLNPTPGNLDLFFTFSNQLSTSGALTAVYLKGVDGSGTIASTATDSTSDLLVLDTTGGANDFGLGAAYGYTGATLTVSVGTELHATGVIGTTPCSTAAEYNAVGYDDAGTNFSVDFTGADATYSVAALAVFKGAPGVNPDFIAPTSILYAPTVINEGLVSPGYIASTAELYAPSLLLDEVISADFISPSSVLYAPTVVKEGTIEPGFIASGSELFGPTFNKSEIANATYNGSWYRDPTYGANWYPPLASPPLVFTAEFIPSGNTLPTPVLTPGPVQIGPGLIASTSVIYPPTLTVDGVIAVPFIASTEVVYDPTVIAQSVQVLSVPFIASTNNLYAPTVSVAFAGTIIDGASSLVISTDYQSKTLYCSPSSGWFTID